jgi:hypothetical protein
LNLTIIAENAWSLVNDALRIPQLALMNSKIVACVCINQASKNYPKLILPSFWWEAFNI